MELNFLFLRKKINETFDKGEKLSVKEVTKVRNLESPRALSDKD